MPSSPSAAPRIIPNAIRPSLGSWWIADSANVGSRKWSSSCVTFGIWMSPPTGARTASVPIAIFIGPSRSAM